MKVFEHLILDTAIIGVSDLSGHNIPGDRVQLFFTVYTTANKINISSPVFEKKTEAGKEQWIKDYLTHRAIIAIQIGEVQTKP